MRTLIIICSLVGLACLAWQYPDFAAGRAASEARSAQLAAELDKARAQIAEVTKELEMANAQIAQLSGQKPQAGAKTNWIQERIRDRTNLPK